ncbi:PREDICTED: receptor-like protein kinase HAIKU2 [Ipomoea nil]|uniref:receptor-like protein kinase HAIKU2 n=1 Tax=Ipomoea nil TaxID=35883 RepID=UPI0009017E10|nr:PREDICTED: receptor-like protein kinase HAIKU2 [Ipomoea nil]
MLWRFPLPIHAEESARRYAHQQLMLSVPQALFVGVSLQTGGVVNCVQEPFTIIFLHLTEKFPVGFLSNLQFLDASINNLTGDLSEIRHLNKLVSLQLFYDQFSGQVPSGLGEFKNLIGLSLYGNQLTGPLPLKLGSWAEFDFIDVSENFFTGPIPPKMCKQGKMRRFLVLQNNFTREIPESYGNCTTLHRFRVSKNSLSGVILSGIWGLPNLDIIDISNNEFEGSLNSGFRNAKALAQLFLGDNKLYGDLPPEISGAWALVSIDLSNNQFSGEIPATIGDLKKLDNLHLSNNNFSGSIPDSLGSCVSLSYINIAQNSLTGKIPVNSLFVEAYNDSFMGNNGLCSEILISIACFLYLKKKSAENEYRERSLKEDSWKMKSFHLLSFTEDEILDGIKQENLIGKGGSGSVYRVVLRTGKELEVKHIWNSGAADDSYFTVY